MTIELRHLRCFLAIAEEGNVTRAARRSNLTQPAASRTLAQLERELGVRLVDRSTHHLVLTDAGRAFERAAFDAVRAFERALAGAAGRGAPIRLGHSWSAGTYLAAIVRAWNATDRPCGVDVVRNDDRTAGLTSGKVDIALTRGPLDRQRFRSVALDHERRVAVVHAQHPLARRPSVRLADLVDLPLVQTDVGVTTPELWPAGARPSVGPVVHTVDDWLVAIASGAGFGVSVVSTSLLHQHPDVAYVPVTDASLVPLLLAWPRQGEHPALRELVRVARVAVGPAENERAARR